MNKITINDERISATPAVAVAKENIKVAITESAPQTFQVWENEKVVEKVLEVLQPPTIQTLKDTDAEISNLEINLSQAEAQVESLTAKLQKVRDLKVELEKVVQVAFDANVIAVAKVEPLPVEKIIK